MKLHDPSSLEFVLDQILLLSHGGVLGNQLVVGTDEQLGLQVMPLDVLEIHVQQCGLK